METAMASKHHDPAWDQAGWVACKHCAEPTPYRLALGDHAVPCCGKFVCEQHLLVTTLPTDLAAAHLRSVERSSRAVAEIIDETRRALGAPPERSLIEHSRLVRAFLDAGVRLDIEPTWENSQSYLNAKTALGLNAAGGAGTCTDSKEVTNGGAAESKPAARVGSADASPTTDTRLRLADEPEAQSKGEETPNAEGSAAAPVLPSATIGATPAAARTPLSGVALDLDAIEARAAAATTGPWAMPLTRSFGEVIAPEHPEPEPEYGGFLIAETVGPPNARFIAAARADVPALCAEIRRLDLVRERWETLCVGHLLSGVRVLRGAREAMNSRLSPLEILEDLEARIVDASKNGPPLTPAESGGLKPWSIR